MQIMFNRRAKKKPPIVVSAGNDFFVDASAGNDANAGTSAGAAWQTIAKVNSRTFTPGQTVSFKGGQTFVGSLAITVSGGSASNKVVVGSYGTGKATISTTVAGNRGIYSLNPTGLTIQDLIVTGPGSTVGTVDGVRIENSQTGNTKLAGVSLLRLDVSNFGYHGIYVRGNNGRSGFDGLLIQDCVAHDCTGNGGNGSTGIIVNSDTGYGQLSAGGASHLNVTITGCKAYNNIGKAGATNWTGSGIVLGEVNGGLITGCEAYNNGQAHNVNNGPVGIWMYDCVAVVIEKCEAHHNKSLALDGGGFDIDGGCQNCTVQYCYSHDNIGAGLMAYSYNDAVLLPDSGNTIRFNVSENDGIGTNGYAGINIGTDSSRAMTGLSVYNNTIYVGSGSTAGFTIIGNNVANTTGRVANNVVVATAGKKLVRFDNVSSLPSLVWRNNDFWPLGTFSADWVGTNYTSLTAWATASGQTANISIDPLISAAPAARTVAGDLTTLIEYKLQQSSTLYHAGIDMQAVFSVNPGTRDYFNTTLSGVLSIGASQTQGAAAAVTTTTYATWSQTQKTGPVALSNGELTATDNGSNGTYNGVRATIPVTVKTYLEFIEPNATVANLWAIGVADASAYSVATGSGPNALYWNGGSVSGSSDTTINNGLGWTQGSTVRMAIDPIAKRVWFAIGSGNWNNSTTANPATNVGGFSCAGITDFIVVTQLWWSNVALTMRPSAAAYAFTPPSGFTGLFTQTTTGGGGTGTPPSGTFAIDAGLLAAAGQPTLDPRTFDTDATIKSGSASGTFIRAFGFSPLNDGETITSITPNDGKLVRDTTNRQLRCGSTATTPGTTIYTLGRSGGGTFTFALTCVAGALRGTYGRDRNWWTRNYRNWLGINSAMLSPHGGYDNQNSNQFVESIGFEIGAPGFRGFRCFTAPLCTPQTTIEAAATGSMDSLWQASFAKILASDEAGGLGHQPVVYVRPGTEMNLYSWAWSAIRNGQTSRDAYKTTFARYVTMFRAYDTLGRVKFVFGPSASLNTDSADEMMPDPSYIDLFGTDLYHEPLFGYSQNPLTALDQAINCTNGPAWVTARANQYGKGKCIPELGCNVDGFGAWIKGLHDYFDANDYTFVTWWESNGAYASELAYGYDEGLYIGQNVPGSPYGDVANKQGNYPLNGAMYRFIANPEMYPENPLARPQLPGVVAVPRNGSVDLYVTPGTAGTAGATIDYVLYMDTQPGAGITLTSGKFTVTGLVNDVAHTYSVAGRNTAGIGFKTKAQSVSASAEATVPSITFGTQGHATASTLGGINGAGTAPVAFDIVFAPSVSDLAATGNDKALIGIWGTTGYIQSFLVALTADGANVMLVTHDNSGNGAGSIYAFATPLQAGHAYRLTATINAGTGVWSASLGPAAGSQTALTRTSGWGLLTTQIGYASPDPSLGNLPPQLMLGDAVMGLNQFSGSIRSVKVTVNGTETVNTTAGASALSDTHGITWSLTGGAIVT